MIEKLVDTLSSVVTAQSLANTNSEAEDGNEERAHLLLKILISLMSSLPQSSSSLISLSTIPTFIQSLTTLSCQVYTCSTSMQRTICCLLLDLIPHIIRAMQRTNLITTPSRRATVNTISPQTLFQTVETPLEHVSLVRMILIMLTTSEPTVLHKVRKAIEAIIPLGHSSARREARTLYAMLSSRQLQPEQSLTTKPTTATPTTEETSNTSLLTKGTSPTIRVLSFLDESPVHRGYMGRALYHLSQQQQHQKTATTTTRAVMHEGTSSLFDQVVQNMKSVLMSI